MIPIPIKTTDVAEAARLINGILAPSLMISACGLLVLALQARYSHLMDRIRVLNEERRSRASDAESDDAARLENIRRQIVILLLRAKSVRNSMICLYGAVVCFVTSSIALGTRLVFGIGPGATIWLALFMLGMAAVLLGALYALKDVAMAFKVAELEVRDLD